MTGVVATGADLNWEKVAEDFAFVFCSSDLEGRVHYVNQGWYDAVEHEVLPQFLPRYAPNRQVYDAFDYSHSDRLRHGYELVRRGIVSHSEELVPTHTGNEHRWALQRLQRLGEEIIFSFYFLRHYTEQMPAAPKIRCLVDGKSWITNWKDDPTPFDDETARALCPNCSLLMYTYLRE